MDIKFNSTSTWPITRESRKMRTTRGPGFTDLKVSVRLHMTGADRHRFTHPFSSRHGLTVGEALTDSRNFVPALLELGADKVTATTSWWTSAQDEAQYDVTYTVHFEGIGHGKMAASAETQIEDMRVMGTLSARVTAVATGELDRVLKLMAQDAKKEKLSWLAGGLVEDARAQAKAKIDYDAKRQQLSTHLANETVNIAVDLISQACTQYGVDEEDLRRAVDGTLEMKTLTLMGM